MAALGACVPQQQLIRDFATLRARALKDIKAGLPMARRAGMPRFKKKRETRPTLEYTRRGFRLRGGRLPLAGGIVVRPVWSRELPKAPSSVRVYRDAVGHWWASFVVPALTGTLPAPGRDRYRLGREGDRDHHIRRPRSATLLGQPVAGLLDGLSPVA